MRTSRPPGPAGPHAGPAGPYAARAPRHTAGVAGAPQQRRPAAPPGAAAPTVVRAERAVNARAAADNAVHGRYPWDSCRFVFCEINNRMCLGFLYAEAMFDLIGYSRAQSRNMIGMPEAM